MHQSSKIKTLKSHKTVQIKVFLNVYPVFGILGSLHWISGPDSALFVNGFQAGLEKTRVFLKKPSPVVFFGFFGFFGVFLVFLGFFGFFCPDKRVFRVFSVSRILLGASRL